MKVTKTTLQHVPRASVYHDVYSKVTSDAFSRVDCDNEDEAKKLAGAARQQKRFDVMRRGKQVFLKRKQRASDTRSEARP